MNDQQLHAHLIGRQGSRHDLNTPVLVLDLDRLDSNIGRMAAFAAAHGLKLRPHAKTHKSVDIAQRQIAAGAVGLCCAKIGEAEALADGGITGLHITSPVVPAPAVDRLAALNLRSAELMTVVDNPDNARAIAQAVERAGDAKLSVIIDVDPGIHRTGVASPEAAVGLLETIRALPALVYRGVQFYCGSHQHIHAFAERETAMRERADYLRAVIAALAEAGGAPEIVTGGGTGTHRIDVGLGIFTELQVGSYIFMDDEYRACDLTGEEDAPIPFETSLMIDTSVISANTPGLFTLDAGIKSMATDAPLPSVETGAPDGARFFLMGDEHGAVLTLPDSLALGDRISLRTPHCDPTVNLYDNYHVVRGQTLDAIWPVSGRGRSR
ncbi:DSD1 family PLP-dependent enzyme [Sphingomonas asaccharolytica]|uniref:DSD1 family PLP-dependent enzyme n=1 Tax=Sphingomonas asaccharolytica TaxID=40681 RepID=UPI00082A8D41|nr:DSD1 family PLP-dependent enzyme [Sphingomonas asaccharolytica]